MANILSMMRKASSFKKDMEKVQSELAAQTVQFSSGKGLVTATASCDGSLKSIKIDPRAINPSKPELLESLVLSAVDGALNASRTIAAKEMSRIASEMGLPGLGL